MPNIDRLIERIRRRPTEADFNDVRRLVEACGWRLARERGSHVHFTKEGERTITVPKTGGRKVKRTYIILVLERLGLDD